MSKRPPAREPGRAFAQCSEERRTPGWLVTAAAGLVHASVFGAAFYLSAPSPSQASRAPQQLLEVEIAPALTPTRAEPVPAPPPEAPKPEPARVKLAKTAPTPPAPVEEPPPETEPPSEAPAAEAAAAGNALTADDKAAETESGAIVTGDSAHYAGGTSERGGSATQAVQAPNARAGGVADGTGSAPVNRSRAPQLAAGTDWNCPFPTEAEEDGIDRATVGLDVEISASGSVLTVAVQNDPGSGFGREARACALKKRWLPALDRDGRAVQQKHRVNVTFVQR